MGNIGIVAFAFGPEPKLASNICVAGLATREAQKTGASVLRQCNLPVDSNVNKFDIEEPGDNWANTLNMAYEALAWAQHNGFTELRIAAAEPHLSRCRRDLEYVVRKTGAKIAITTCTGIEEYGNSVWFCKESSQWRTRTWFNWWFGWELWVGNAPMWLYCFATTGKWS